MLENNSKISWRVAAIGTLAIVVSLLVSDYEESPEAILAAVGAVALLALAPRFPISAGLGFTALAILVAAFEDLRSAMIILSSALLVALIARAGRWRFAIGIGVVLGYISTTSVFTDRFVPYDPVGTLIMFALLAAGCWAGIVVRQIRLKHQSESKRLAAQIENNREQLSRTLHDSVATTLTSVVMRAETLGLTKELSDSVRADAQLIAEETRQAMQEIRHLIQVMKDGQPQDVPLIARTVAEQLSITERVLRSHGFAVSIDCHPELKKMSFPAGLEAVFTELATNAIKYAVPSSHIKMSLDLTPDECRFTMTNSITPSKVPQHLSSGVGLNQVRRILAGVDSTLRTSAAAGTFAASFGIPLTHLHQ